MKLIPENDELMLVLGYHAFVYMLTFGNVCHIRAINDLYAIYIGEDIRLVLKETWEL